MGGALEVFFKPGTQKRSDWVTDVEIRLSGVLVATIGTVDPSTLLYSPVHKGAGLLSSMAAEINGTKVLAEGIWSLLGGLSITVEASIKTAPEAPFPLAVAASTASRSKPATLSCVCAPPRPTRWRPRRSASSPCTWTSSGCASTRTSALACCQRSGVYGPSLLWPRA